MLYMRRLRAANVVSDDMTRAMRVGVMKARIARTTDELEAFCAGEDADFSDVEGELGSRYQRIVTPYMKG